MDGSTRMATDTREAVKQFGHRAAPQEGYAEVFFTLTVAFYLRLRPRAWLARRLEVPASASITDQRWWDEVVNRGTTLTPAEACGVFPDWYLRAGVYAQAAPAPTAGDRSTTPG